MGGRLFGGRWNSEGRSAVYLASSRSLAILEVLVHLSPMMIPDDYCMIEIEVPEDNTTQIDLKKLPPDWNDISPPVGCKTFGDEFLKCEKYLLLQLPSSIVPEEYNYLLNPSHSDMGEVKILKKSPFNFDERLI
jgi:RES domain-containing protein